MHVCSLQLWALGVETPRDDVELRSQMAYGMFDTRGQCVTSFHQRTVATCSHLCRRFSMRSVTRIVVILSNHG